MTPCRVIPLLFALTATGATQAQAQGAAASLPSPADGATTAATAAGGAEATDLKFAEMYRLPVGPRGLEATPKLLSLDGRRVRLVGYMASAERPMAGRLVLTPLPVSLGDEDESLSDDLPASAVFVHLGGAAAQRSLPNLAGLLQLTGTLRLGAQEEPDGHVSAVRLLLDDADSRGLVDAMAPAAATAAASRPAAPSATTAATPRP